MVERFQGEENMEVCWWLNKIEVAICGDVPCAKVGEQLGTQRRWVVAGEING